jgi:hypothetical protein
MQKFKKGDRVRILTKKSKVSKIVDAIRTFQDHNGYIKSRVLYKVNNSYFFSYELEKAK